MRDAVRVRDKMLVKVWAASVLVVATACFLGPYDYQFRSGGGIPYYFAGLIAFVLPMVFGRTSERVSGSATPRWGLSRSAEQILAILMASSIGAALIFTAEIVRLFSWDALLQGGDFRQEFGNERSGLSKVAEIVSALGPACFLVVNASSALGTKGLRFLSHAALFSMGLTGLLLGARWKLFVCVLILIFAIAQNRTVGRAAGDAVSAGRGKLFAAGLLASVGYAFYSLFAVRGVLSADNQYRFYPGDMPLKDWAFELFSASEGSLQPLYRAIDYVGQAPYVFSTLYVDFLPGDAYLGAYLLRPVGVLASMLGIPFPSHGEIVEATFTGMYSGSSFGLIVDFGQIGGIVAFFVAGLLFRHVELRRADAMASRVMFPLVSTMTACAPVYYLFHVGYVDYILVWLFFVLISVALVGGWQQIDRLGGEGVE